MQSKSLQGRYVSILGSQLFRRKEMENKNERNKFLQRVKEASKHLASLYLPSSSAYSEEDAEELPLHRHPSKGIKSLAEKVYASLEQHWKCQCSQRASGQARSREAKLNLVRYRQLALTMPKDYLALPKFEILLPVCTARGGWRVTNFEVTR